MFKVGDKVRCVTQWHRDEKVGEVYTVASTRINGEGSTMMQLQELIAAVPFHSFYQYRYTLADSSTAAPVGEHDPSGKSLNEPGAKADAGKLRPALVFSGFADALEAVALVGTKGAAKYTPNGWLSVPNGFERYSDAQVRHELKRHKGETHDADSGDLHLAHEAWNALAKLQLYINSKKAPIVPQ